MMLHKAKHGGWRERLMAVVAALVVGGEPWCALAFDGAIH